MDCTYCLRPGYWTLHAGNHEIPMCEPHGVETDVYIEMQDRVFRSKFGATGYPVWQRTE